MKEQQISFSAKNHSLDNNDNFSPDDRFLCYDTRGTVYNANLANCKSIEKIEIATGKETVLWEPESVTGEEAAPGVAAVSWHPTEDKVIFIHGPLLEEVESRGYYNIRNRTGVEVSADGKGTFTRIDCRDISTDRPTATGAHRGGTHRHEYTRNGKRIGFTYDDYLLPQFDRTVGYMESVEAARLKCTHYFAVLLNPAETGKSQPGEIEKAWGDSWIDPEGTMRAFIGKVRTENRRDYEPALFVADIPPQTNITTAYSGDGTHFPEPPHGIRIRRLTNGLAVHGIVRGSADGKKIAFLAEDTRGIKQIYILDSQSGLENHELARPKQLSRLSSDADFIRWHPSGNWIVAIVKGNVAAVCTAENDDFGKVIFLTSDDKERTELVVSNNGNRLAYNIKVARSAKSKCYSQVFIMEPDWEQMKLKLKGRYNKKNQKDNGTVKN